MIKNYDKINMTMKYVKNINEYEMPSKGGETEVQAGLLKMFVKGLGIDPEQVTSVESNNKFMIVHTKADSFRIDMTMRHHFAND